MHDIPMELIQLPPIESGLSKVGLRCFPALNEDASELLGLKKLQNQVIIRDRLCQCCYTSVLTNG